MGKPIKLDEVKTWLEDNNLSLESDERLEECYNHISNPALRVNADDKQWVACTDSSEVQTVIDAIDKTTADKYEDFEVEVAVEVSCTLFDHIHNKPRIPFYVHVIDALIPAE